MLFLLMPDKNRLRCLALFPLTSALSLEGRGRINIETLSSSPIPLEGEGRGEVVFVSIQLSRDFHVKLR